MGAHLKVKLAAKYLPLFRTCDRNFPDDGGVSRAFNEVFSLVPERNDFSMTDEIMYFMAKNGSSTRCVANATELNPVFVMAKRGWFVCQKRPLKTFHPSSERRGEE